ncbi:hypothetical protein [Streptomyces sp. NPDC001820]|uniref:hypothetical protein n=1 Tax=Streptomyces sp. NPDC001820 TaxID=3364613 RepID=UPI00368761A4
MPGVERGPPLFFRRLRRRGVRGRADDRLERREFVVSRTGQHLGRGLLRGDGSCVGLLGVLLCAPGEPVAGLEVRAA